MREGDCGSELSDRAGAARAPLLRELVAGKRLPRSSEKLTPPLPGLLPSNSLPGRAPSGPGACLLLWGGLGAGEEPATPFRRFPRLRAALWGILGQRHSKVTPPFPPSSTRRQWGQTGILAVFRLLRRGPADLYCKAVGCVIGFQFDLVTSPR